MFYAFALLCLLAPVALEATSTPGFNVRHVNDDGTYSFIDLPQTSTAAEKKGWVKLDHHPERPPQYKSLTMWCNALGYSLCVLFDLLENAAGVQVALDEKYLTDVVYDLTVEGMTKWSPTLNGTTVNYWTTAVYFIESDTASSIQSRNSSKFLPEDYVYATGFYGEVYKISTTMSENPIWNKQACIDGLGIHYTYNLTESQVCTSETFFPWFIMTNGDDFTSIDFFTCATRSLPAGQWDWFERFYKTDTEVGVPYAPTCIHDYAASPGYVGLKIFFMQDPASITC